MALPLVSPNPSALHLFSPSRSHTLRVPLPSRLVEISPSSQLRRASIVRAMQSSGVNSSESSQGDVKGTNSNRLPPQSAGLSLPLPDIPIGTRLGLGAILLLAIPFYKRILKLEDKVEKAAETVVEGVEKAAEMAVKISSDVANAIPDSGVLKQVALKVEHKAEEFFQEAKLADTILHKIDEITDEVERTVDPNVEKGEIMEKES